jgi:uncharacterized OsmC-like protein
VAEGESHDYARNSGSSARRHGVPYDRDIELTGDLDDVQRQQFMHIAELCPVHQTLTSEVDVTTSLR